MSFHKTLTGGDIHSLNAFTYADATARLAAAGFVESDVGKMARQVSDSSFWMLGTISPAVVWDPLGGSNPADGVIAVHAFNLAVAGTNAANAATTIAGEAFTLATVGTNAANAALTIAGEAFTLATVGTNAAQAANVIAGEAFTLATVGTNAAQAANVIAGEAFTLAIAGTNAAAAAYSLAAHADSLAVAGTTAANSADMWGRDAFSLAVAGTNAAAAAYAEAVAAFNLASNGTSAASANALASAANSVATSAYTLATNGTLPDSGDYCSDDFQSYFVGQTSGFNGGGGWTTNGTADGCVVISQSMPFGAPIQKLRIQQGEYIRQFGFGSKWHKIRIGVSGRINSAVTFTTTTPSWALGVCSGNTGYKSTSTGNMVFTGLNTAFFPGTVTFTKTAGVDVDYFLSTANNIATRRGNTDSNNNTGPSRVLFTAAGTNRGLILGLEITRNTFGSTTYTIKSAAIQNVAPFQEADLGLKDLETALNEAPTTGFNLNGYSNTAGATASFTFDETTGTLDGMSFYWGDPSHPIELSAIAAWKIY